MSLGDQWHCNPYRSVCLFLHPVIAEQGWVWVPQRSSSGSVSSPTCSILWWLCLWVACWHLAWASPSSCWCPAPPVWRYLLQAFLRWEYIFVAFTYLWVITKTCRSSLYPSSFCFSPFLNSLARFQSLH